VLSHYEHYDPVPGLDAVQCSHAALSCFMTSLSLEGALLSAVNLGGDADTVGACCGALAGAYWGLEAIPLRWRTALERYPALVRLGEDLWRCAGERGVRPAGSQRA
jgi:ADP-ribosyl-[dinitrogen reductase] hydrolase